MSAYERCTECGGTTERAGKAEDSLYIGDFGPYCEDCFEAMPEEFAVAAENYKAIVARLRAEKAELVAALDDCSTRLRACVVNVGTDSEYADILVQKYRALVARAQAEPHDSEGETG